MLCLLRNMYFNQMFVKKTVGSKPRCLQYVAYIWTLTWNRKTRASQVRSWLLVVSVCYTSCKAIWEVTNLNICMTMCWLVCLVRKETGYRIISWFNWQRIVWLRRDYFLQTDVFELPPLLYHTLYPCKWRPCIKITFSSKTKSQTLFNKLNTPSYQ